MAFAINAGLKRIKDIIPPELLRRAFMPTQYDTYYNVQTIESVIMTEVIRNSVIPDCNRNGGTTMTIPIMAHWVERFDIPPRIVISIPPEARQYQEITAVRIVGYSNIGMSYQGYLPSSVNPVGMSQTLNYARMVMDASSSIQPLVCSSVKVSPDGGGLVVLDAPTRVTMPLCATVVLGYDSEMSDLSNNMTFLFAKLCEYAAKRYIYTNLDISVDRAELEGGASIGRFADRLREYSDAAAEYDRLLEEEWYGATVYDNPISKENFITSMIGPGR